MAKGLRECGVNVFFGDDYMTVKGKREVRGGQLINTFSDHRIAMSFICGQISPKPIEISESFNDTSFPDLLRSLTKLEQTYRVKRTNNYCNGRVFQLQEKVLLER